jgi:phospholipid transport system substrate-binding protein
MSQGWKPSARCSQWLVWIIAGLVGLSIGLARPALAAGPQERVGEILAAVSAVTQDPQLQGANHQMERKQRVRRIIVDAFDFAEMGRVALAAHWARLTAEQQTEFTNLFGDLFERSDNRLVLRVLSERETMYGAVSQEQDRAMVHTTLIVRSTNEQLPVNYRLLEKGGQWAVFDRARTLLVVE